MPQDIAIPVAVGTLLIDAARAEGISMEISCDGGGACGKCKAKVSAEHRRMLGDNGPDSLTQATRDGGWVLACQTVVLGDVQVEIEATGGDGLQILSEEQTLSVEIDP
jgi:Na+-transporting NADH:ubiquinone oxidoreductase subunit F